MPDEIRKEKIKIMVSVHLLWNGRHTWTHNDRSSTRRKGSKGRILQLAFDELGITPTDG